MVVGLPGTDAGVSIAINAIDNFSKTFGTAKTTMSGFKSSGLAIAAGMIAIAGGITAIASATVTAAMDYETALTGIKKTVDLTADEFNELDRSLRDMTKEIPMTYTELAGIAEIAGQLGVKGKDNILKFVKTISAVGVTTNMTAEQAATDFARIANVMGIPISDIDRMASSVVDLGNNFATSESEIIEMSKRIMGSGKTIGLSTQEVFGMSAALSSLGIQSEMGGSAISKAMIIIDKSVATGSEELEHYAKVSGMSTDEFSKMWKDKPVEAMSKVIMGLKDVSESGGNTFGVLEDLDLKSIRVTDTMLRLAGSEGGITEAVDLSTKAWAENTALTDEAEKRYGTLASQIQITKNEFSLLAADIGEKLMPMIKDTLLPFIKNELIPTLDRIFDKISIVIKNDILPLIENYLIPAIHKLTEFTVWLKDSWNNLSPEMQNAVKIGLLATGIVLALAASAVVLGIILGILTSPLLAVALAIGAIIAIGYYLYKHWDKLKEKAKEFGVGVKNVFIGLRNTITIVWNGIVNTIARSINNIINMINELIRKANKVPGVNISQLGNVNLGRFKGDMMAYEKYTAPIETTTTAQNVTNVNINNLNGFNSRDIANQLQSELNKKI